MALILLLGVSGAAFEGVEGVDSAIELADEAIAGVSASQ